MKTHTKPALIPGQIVYVASQDGVNILQTTVERTVTNGIYTEYHLTGYIDPFRSGRLHTTFESALAALK